MTEVDTRKLLENLASELPKGGPSPNVERVLEYVNFLGCPFADEPQKTAWLHGFLTAVTRGR